MEHFFLETQDALVDHWRMTPVAETEEKLNWDLLLEALEERIYELLRTNMQKLYTAVYLLDISERRFNTAMTLPTLKEKAHALAECILLRESEKIEMRKKYPAPSREYLEDQDSATNGDSQRKETTS